MTGNGFTAEEMHLIKGEGIMRVLKSDKPKDLSVLNMKAKALTDEMMESDAYRDLCGRMLITVTAPENDGVGIAAPQVGVSRRLVAVQRFDKEGEPFEFFANPEIVRYGAEKTPGREGCLSVPGMRGIVARSREIDVRYRTSHGTDTLETVSGFTAVIFQHEIDHLDGILYSDRASSIGNDYMETRVLEDGSRLTWIRDNAEPHLMPRALFPDASDALIAELGLQAGIPASVSVFLLEKDGVRILFDGGNGVSDSRMPAALETKGLAAEDIDYVYITHLHGDHIGGLLKGSEAAFPKARIYLSKAEYDGWMNMPETQNAKQRELMAAYEGRLNLFEPGTLLPAGVEGIAAFGHTPGHTAYLTGNALIVGDILHGAALQLLHPEFCAEFDMNKTAAVASRKMILEYAAANQLLMCGMHFPALFPSRFAY